MNAHDPSRRKLLRGTLAGCVAVSAAGLFACDQQQKASSTRTDAAEPNEPHPTDPQPNDPRPSDPQPRQQSESPDAGSAKLSKEQAQYQPQPKGDQQCSNCQHFVSDDNTCKVVAGTVEPTGWSILWAAKA